ARAGRPIAAARAARRDSRHRAAVARGIGDLLRQRGHLQSRAAGAGRAAWRAQGAQHRRARARHDRDRQPRMHAADCRSRTAARLQLEDRSPDRTDRSVDQGNKETGGLRDFVPKSPSPQVPFKESEMSYGPSISLDNAKKVAAAALAEVRTDN